MLKAYIILFLILFTSSLPPQNTGSNPFDIEGRQDSLVVQTVSDNQSTKKSSEAKENVFDINRGQGSAHMESQTRELGNNSTLTEQQPIENGSNPFEVSHIPLRKSKLKNEADAFSVKNTTLKTIDTGRSQSYTFIFWLVLVSTFIIAFVINTKRTVIPSMAKSLTNTNILTYNKREQSGGFSGHYLLLYIVYFINAAIFIYLLLDKYESLGIKAVFLYCFLGVLSIYLLKHLLLYIIGSVFPIEKEVGVYNFSIQVHNNLLGLALIPLNLIIAYGPLSLSKAFLYFGIFVVVILYILRSLRGILVAATFVASKSCQCCFLLKQ